MKSTKILPTDYEQESMLDLKKNKRLLIILTIVALVLFFVFGWFFLTISSYISPQFHNARLTITGLQLIEVLFIMLIVSVLVMIIHELIHGVFFWLFTQSLPTFGVKGLYAFAAAPDWYIPRNPFIIIGLAPLVIISLVGIVIVPLLPFYVILGLVFAMTMNAAGAVGDIYIVGLLLTKPSIMLTRDFGDGMAMYLPKQAVDPVIALTESI